jgi:hypothetical protein
MPLPTENLPVNARGLPTHVAASLAKSARGFDAATYPHLVDLVFAHADAHDLVRLRTACRAWRQRADRALSTHVINIAGTAHAVGAPGDLIPHPALAPPLGDKGQGRPKAQESRKAQERCAAAKATLAAATKNLHVVDCIDRSQLSTSADLDNPLPFLRLWETLKDAQPIDYQAPPVDTVVLFAWVSPKVKKVGLHGQLWAAFRHTEARRLVINLSSATRSRRPADADFIDLGGAEEVVINLSMLPTPVASKKPQAMEWARLPYLLRRAVEVRDTPTQFTFVNTEALPRELLPLLLGRDNTYTWKFRCPATWEAFQTAASFQEGAHAYFKEAGKTGGNFSVPRFFTPAQYEAEVGTETYWIETLEQPWRV